MKWFRELYNKGRFIKDAAPRVRSFLAPYTDVLESFELCIDEMKEDSILICLQCYVYIVETDPKLTSEQKRDILLNFSQSLDKCRFI